MSLVSVVSVSDPFNVKKAVQKATELIDARLSSELRTIVIKPDACYYWDYSTGQTTDPRFVAGLVGYLRDCVSSDSEIIVAESDTASRRCEDVLKFLGYGRLAAEKGLRLVNLGKEASEEVHVQVGDRKFSFLLPSLLRKADLFIDVPKIKRSPVAKIACSIQNLYGCNPDPKKPEYGFQTDEATVAFNKLIRPHLCLAEGLVVQGKRTANLGCLLAGVDPVAVDVVAARILGFDAERINHLYLASMENLGSLKYRIVGESVESYVERFPTENARDKIWSTLSHLGLLTFKKLGRRTDFYS